MKKTILYISLGLVTFLYGQTQLNWNTQLRNRPNITRVGTNSTWTDNVTLTNVFTPKDINHQRQIDGTTYPLTAAGFQQAVTDCVADSLCVEVNTPQLGAITTTATISLTKPMLLRIGANTAITGGAAVNPVVCYSSSVSIDGGMGEGTNGALAAIKTATAANEIIAPCTPASQTNNFTARGVDFWNTNAAATATLVDLTNCRYCTLGPNTRVQKSGGSASLILVTTTGGLSDFFNDFINVVLQGQDGNGRGYDFENAANAQTILGGEIEMVADPVYCNGGAGALKTNNVSFHGTQMENWTGAAFHLVQNCNAFRTHSIRLESSAGTWFNIASSVNNDDFQDYGSFHASTFTYGSDAGVVSLWGCSSNCAPGPSVEGAVAHTFQSAVFKGVGGSQGASVFSQSVSGQDIINFTSDAFANVNNGVLFTGTHAGGSQWRFAPDSFGLGRFSFRCFSGCTGQAVWSLATTSTGSFEGILTHGNTASRTYTFPDISGTVLVNPNSGPLLSATSTAFATATTAGTCVQNTTAVTGATTSMSVVVSPNATPGVGAVWSAFVSSAGNVTINECAVALSGGGTIAFNIRVIP